MADFLTAQLDYVWFAYGLVLVLLGAVCVSMTREGPLPLPWRLLAATAFAQAGAQWLEIAEFSGFDAAPLLVTRTALVAAGFAFLLEFARRSHAILRGSGPGAWVHALAAVASLLLLAGLGWNRVTVAIRVGMGLPAVLWTATLLVGAARQEGTTGEAGVARRTLLAMGLSFGAFGLALVVEPTRSPYAALARVALVGTLSLAVWAYAVSLDPSGRLLRKRWRTFWLAAATIVATISGGWVLTERLGELHAAEVASETASIADQVGDHLAMEMAAAADGADALAGVLGRLGLLEPGASAGADLDSIVDSFGNRSEGRIAYVLDRGGRTVSSSNRRDADSFAGQSYARRPYFLAALDGWRGAFAGIGLTSGQPGFYASAPVLDAEGGVLGVAVVKQALSPRSLGSFETARTVLVDAQGAAVLSSSPEPDGGPPRMAQGATAEWTRSGSGRAYVLRRAVPVSDWTLVVSKRETTQLTNRLLGIVITLLLSVVVAGTFVALQRQYGAESRQTERRREAERRARSLARRAGTDALTGLMNRAGFDEVMAHEVARARRHGLPLGLAIVDLDHFKRVNDEHGHPAGDRVLVTTARLLQSSVRETDTVARWGGEEFAVVAPMTDLEGVGALAEKLRALLEATHLGPSGRVTASFGVASLLPDESVEAFLGRADQALYAAKTSGRNQVRRAEPDAGPPAAVARDGGDASRAPAARRTYADSGFGPMDEQHATLGSALDAFVDLVHAEQAGPIGPSLDALVKAVAEHFADEERLMDAYDYPLTRRHVEAHQSFLRDAEKHRDVFRRYGITADFRQWAVGRLREWFRYHILAHDIGLGRFLLRVVPEGDGPTSFDLEAAASAPVAHELPRVRGEAR